MSTVIYDTTLSPVLGPYQKKWCLLIFLRSVVDLRKDDCRYITVATIDPIVDLKRGDGYCIIGRLINKK